MLSGETVCVEELKAAPSVTAVSMVHLKLVIVQKPVATG